MPCTGRSISGASLAVFAPVKEVVGRLSRNLPMTTKRGALYRSILLSLATVMMVCVVGYLAHQAGVKKGLQEAFYCNAIHAQGYVSALRALRSGDAEQGLRALEVSLDAGVVLMAPDKDSLENRTAKSVNSALLTVKDYRAAYPRVGRSEATAKADAILSSAKKAN
jgi:hypothetical protein